MSVGTGMNPKANEALDHIRAAAQELHGALSDAAAKQGGAIKADLEALQKMAGAAAESIKKAMDGQNEVTKKHLEDAATQLEAARKHAAEGLMSSGQAFQNSVQQALAGAHAFVRQVSEAVAAKRSADSGQSPKT